MVSGCTNSSPSSNSSKTSPDARKSKRMFSKSLQSCLLWQYYSVFAVSDKSIYIPRSHVELYRSVMEVLSNKMFEAWGPQGMVKEKNYIGSYFTFPILVLFMGRCTGRTAKSCTEKSARALTWAISEEGTSTTKAGESRGRKIKTSSRTCNNKSYSLRDCWRLLPVNTTVLVYSL